MGQEMRPEDIQARRINLNKATYEELTEILGMNEMNAKMFIKYRDEQGFYHKWEDLTKVPGFTEELLEEIKRGGGSLE